MIVLVGNFAVGCGSWTN